MCGWETNAKNSFNKHNTAYLSKLYKNLNKNSDSLSQTKSHMSSTSFSLDVVGVTCTGETCLCDRSVAAESGREDPWSSSEPLWSHPPCVWWASAPQAELLRSNTDRGGATGRAWAGTPHGLYTHTHTHTHKATVSSHRKWHNNRGISEDVFVLAQTNSPGLGVQEAVDEFHIIRVHAIIMALHEETWKLQRKPTTFTHWHRTTVTRSCSERIVWS